MGGNTLKKLLFVFIGLLLFFVTACNHKVEYNENEYVHSLTSIIDPNSGHKYKYALPDEMEFADAWVTASVRMHLYERDEIIKVYKPLKNINFRYVKELSKEQTKEFLLSYGVNLYFGEKVVHFAIKRDGTVMFRNLNDDYFTSESNVINLNEYMEIIYNEWSKHN